MHCLKCGKETQENQPFCEKCLIVMSGYPVKPDAKVHLPRRSQSAIQKKQAPRKRTPTPEEKLAALSKLVRNLMIALLVVSLLFVISLAMLIHNHKNPDDAPTAIGRNYTVETDDAG